mgnify:CR=1 FL=1
MRNYHQGHYKAINPEKYAGNPDQIIYRSSWEAKVFSWLDNHPDVILWGSEELVIPYWDSVQNKKRRYFPDIIVKMRQKSGNVATYVIEIKPEYQTKQPVKKRKTQTFIDETLTYVNNQSKWNAAKKFCEDKGWNFIIITEKSLGLLAK